MQKNDNESINKENVFLWLNNWIENHVRASADPGDDIPTVEALEWKKVCLQAAADEDYTPSDLNAAAGGEDELILMLHKAVCADWEAQMKRATFRD